MTILSRDLPYAKKRQKWGIALVATVLALVLTMDIVFIVLRSDSNHVLFLILSLVLSVLAAFWAIFYIDMVLVPSHKRIAAYEKARNNQKQIVEIQAISDYSLHVSGFDVHKVRYVQDGEQKQCFLIDGTMNGLNEGTYRVNIHRGILIEAEKHGE